MPNNYNFEEDEIEYKLNPGKMEIPSPRDEFIYNTPTPEEMEQIMNIDTTIKHGLIDSINEIKLMIDSSNVFRPHMAERFLNKFTDEFNTQNELNSTTLTAT